MTSRARTVLLEEIDASGPVRRSEIESARAELTALARKLIQRGEIGARDADDDELVE